MLRRESWHATQGPHCCPRDPAGAAPDTDKMIAMQLLLDVQEFGRLAGAAGVDLAGVEAYQQLWDTVSAQPEEEAAAS